MQQKQIFPYADDVILSARSNKRPSVFPKAEGKRYSVYFHGGGKKPEIYKHLKSWNQRIVSLFFEEKHANQLIDH